MNFHYLNNSRPSDAPPSRALPIEAQANFFCVVTQWGARELFKFSSSARAEFLEAEKKV